MNKSEALKVKKKENKMAIMTLKMMPEIWMMLVGKNKKMNRKTMMMKRAKKILKMKWVMLKKKWTTKCGKIKKIRN